MRDGQGESPSKKYREDIIKKKSHLSEDTMKVKAEDNTDERGTFEALI